MGLFRRGDRPVPTDATSSSDAPGDDLSTILLQGEDMIDQLATTHQQWGLGTADRWDLDQRTGLITWTFADRIATAPAQILGSHHPGAGSWQWAWANPSILPAMARDAHVVKQWADAGGHDALALPTVSADESMAATLAAIAVRVTRAVGFYRGPGPSATTYLTFGEVTIVDDTGRTSAVRIAVE